MKHLLLCREYPPAPMPPGGIGTYARHLTRLIAARGETVHVIAQRWEGAARATETLAGGRIVVHRVPVDGRDDAARALAASVFPSERFAWQAGRLAETLVEREGIDVVEAQDWEAPLYYLQLRRALGLGPARRPPCIVHLHSPTEMIFRHNAWDVGRPDYLQAKRNEDFSIAAADAWLCPSRYVARQAEAHYGLGAGSVEVIPYPLGDVPCLGRTPETWRTGAILYVGRLEPRKGVVEWIEAAVEAARIHADARFELVGADLPHRDGTSMRRLLEGFIPAALRARFVFRAAQDRPALLALLARARLAVVPSRWDNFPNTCVEAMCSGLPVIASREGGMAEMIEDGRTGWLAAEPGTTGLAGALRRALEAPPAEVAAKGRAAAAAIRSFCCNPAIVERQLDFRNRVARRGAVRSLDVPQNLPWTRARSVAPPPRRPASAGGNLALVIVAGAQVDDRTMHAVRGQTLSPAAVAVVAPEPASPALAQARTRDWLPVCAAGPAGAMKAAAVEAVLARGMPPLGFVFLGAEDRPSRDLVAACTDVLRRRPGVGIVSFWVARRGVETVDVRPCPALPYQWLGDDVVPCAAVRTAAILDAGGVRPHLGGGYESWDLANAVMAAGWAAVTLPEILAEVRGSAEPGDEPGLRREVLARFPALVACDAEELALLLEARAGSGTRPGPARPQLQAGTPAVVLRRPVRQQLVLGRMALADPPRAVRWIVRHGRRAAARILGHALGVAHETSHRLS